MGFSHNFPGFSRRSTTPTLHFINIFNLFVIVAEHPTKSPSKK
jgi:hypothetical protein